MHSVITPAIMYWGTPVVLITSENPDGTPNIAPISSAWWLGHRCVLGLSAISQTTANIQRTKQCVLNLPSDDMAPQINAIAKTTGSYPIPEFKLGCGYEHVRDKFQRAGLAPQPSEIVRPPRIVECPVQMEAEVRLVTEMMQEIPDRKGALLMVEVQVVRTHVRDDLRLPGHANRVDPDKWRPMIMSFQEFYGLAPRNTASKLASIDEERYRVLTLSDVVRPADKIYDGNVDKGEK